MFWFGFGYICIREQGRVISSCQKEAESTYSALSGNGSNKGLMLIIIITLRTLTDRNTRMSTTYLHSYTHVQIEVMAPPYTIFWNLISLDHVLLSCAKVLISTAARVGYIQNLVSGDVYVSRMSSNISNITSNHQTKFCVLNFIAHFTTSVTSVNSFHFIDVGYERSTFA